MLHDIARANLILSEASDFVRLMNMLEKDIAAGELELVATKNRFEEPTSLGWRDLIFVLRFLPGNREGANSNFYFELQVTHYKLANADRRNTDVFEQIRFFQELMGPTISQNGGRMASRAGSSKGGPSPLDGDGYY